MLSILQNRANTIGRGMFDVKNRLFSSVMYNMSFLMLCLLLFVRYALLIEIPTIVFLGLITLTSVFANFSGLLALAASFIPLSTILQYKYGLLIIIVVYLFKYRNDISFHLAFFSFFIMAFWELIHCFAGSFSLLEYARSITELLFISLIFFNVKKKITKISVDYKMIVRILSLSVLCVCFIILRINISRNGFGVILDSFGRTRFGFVDTYYSDLNASINPNIIGGLCTFSIATILQLISSKNGRLLDYIALILLYSFVILTQSKMAIISGAVLFLIFLGTNSSLVSFFKRLVALGIILLFIYCLIVKLYPEVIEMIANRFSQTDISNGRFDLFYDYYELFMSNQQIMLFGVGLQDFSTKLITGYGMINVPHNALQEMIAVWGIVGMCLFFAFIIAVVSQNKKYLRLINLLPAISLLLFIFNDQFITNGKMILMLMVSFISLSIDFVSHRHVNLRKNTV